MSVIEREGRDTAARLKLWLGWWEPAGAKAGKRGKERRPLARPTGRTGWLRREQRQADGERGKGARSCEREGRNSRAGRQRGEDQAFRLN